MNEVEVTNVEAPPVEPQAATTAPVGFRAHVAEAFQAAQSLAGTVVIALFVITFVIQAFQIPSESMENTLLIGDYLLVDKVGYGPQGSWPAVLPYTPVKRGDIIVFKWPLKPEQHFVKRVIGLPGDRVRIVGGVVFVNGKKIEEPYVIHKAPEAVVRVRDHFPSRLPTQYDTAGWYAEVGKLTRNGDLLVPEDNFFVLGDNRDESLDSRYWGLVPRESLVGKPLMIYFSMKQQSEIGGSTPDGKILRLAYLVWNLPATARWGRTFRFVN